MRQMSAKRRERYFEAKPVRDALRAEVAECEVCGNDRVSFDVHEICRGVHRQKALDKRYALLLVCRSCHEELGYAGEWPEERQLALLAERRPLDFDLVAYLNLTNPNAPRRIEIEEIEAYMSEELLKVEEVADRMRVNRRTVQSWIDGGRLPAIDCRPEGALRAMWRVQPDDLVKFAQERKSRQSEHPSIQEHENLLD